MLWQQVTTESCQPLESSWFLPNPDYENQCNPAKGKILKLYGRGHMEREQWLFKDLSWSQGTWTLNLFKDTFHPDCLGCSLVTNLSDHPFTHEPRHRTVTKDGGAQEPGGFVRRWKHQNRPWRPLGDVFSSHTWWSQTTVELKNTLKKICVYIYQQIKLNKNFFRNHINHYFIMISKLASATGRNVPG